jgi:hypothetical protein
MRAKVLRWSAAALLMLFANISLVMAQDEATATQKAGPSQDIETRMSGAESEAPTAPAAVTVNGGPVKQVLGVYNNTAQTTKSTAFVALTGATRVINVPAGGDTVLITFSAECELLPSANNGIDSVEVVIRDGATTIFGNGDSSFCGGQDYNQNSLQVVRRLAAGSHTIRVYFRTTNAAREAWLDDWALTILQSD